MEPTRITLARRMAGKAKSHLAKDVGVSPATVNLWEDGLRDATAKLPKLVVALEQPALFFLGEEVPTTRHESVSFRKRYDATRATRDKAAAAVDLAAGILQPAIQNFFTRFPAVDVPDLSGMKPEAAADALRRQWGLTDGPLRDVVELLESKGVRVFWVADGSPSLSAFCRWVDGEPFVILNMAKRDGCRSRFDACHELAHLVLHRDTDFETADPKVIEREADAFASAFLLPRETFVPMAPGGFDPATFLELKRDWRVSVQAMVRRLKDVGRFTDWQYEYAYRWMSAEGWRSNPEPYAGPMETSKVHWKLCEKLQERGMTPHDFARNLNLQWDGVVRMMPALETAYVNIASLLDQDGPLRIDSLLGETLPYDG